MENIVETISMMIITYSGVAKSSAMAAVDLAEEGDFEAAEASLKEASDAMIEAGKEHYKAMGLEAEGKLELGLLLMHAEDQMLTAELAIETSKKMINIWKAIKNHG